MLSKTGLARTRNTNHDNHVWIFGSQGFHVRQYTRYIPVLLGGRMNSTVNTSYFTSAVTVTTVSLDVVVVTPAWSRLSADAFDCQNRYAPTAATTTIIRTTKRMTTVLEDFLAGSVTGATAATVATCSATGELTVSVDGSANVTGSDEAGCSLATGGVLFGVDCGANASFGTADSVVVVGFSATGSLPRVSTAC